MQSDLFVPPEAPRQEPPELRPYQVAAVERIRAFMASDVRAGLVVMATGLGKTEIAVEAVKECPKRVLWLAHRDELIRQAANRIEQRTDKAVGVEKAGETVRDADVVVGSIQTMTQDRRLSHFEPGEFGLVVQDEAHHATAASFRKVLDYFSGAKVLGLTATPNRADEQALGQVFDEVLYTYELDDAIRDGWLAPIRCTQIFCESMQLQDVGTVAGDFNQGELDRVMAVEKVLHEIAKPTLELVGGRRTLLFCSSVETAHRLAEVFNRYRPDCAAAVDGAMEMNARRRVITDHKAGRFQFLCNVMVLTEGYDDPTLGCIVMARPTKSTPLYTQMVGRGTRLAPGKDHLLLLDLVGNVGKHKLVTAVDILGGKYEPEVVERAKSKEHTNPVEALEAAKAEIAAERQREAARRAKLRASVKYATADVDPFAVFGLKRPPKEWERWAQPPSEKQVEALAKMRIPLPLGCTKRMAGQLIYEQIDRYKHNLCTFGQAKVLGRYGYDTRMSRTEASATLDALKANNWRPPAEREPGMEG